MIPQQYNFHYFLNFLFIIFKRNVGAIYEILLRFEKKMYHEIVFNQRYVWLPRKKN